MQDEICPRVLNMTDVLCACMSVFGTGEHDSFNETAAYEGLSLVLREAAAW